MASFEFLAIILTGLGLIISLVYYENVLRNQNITRQAQLYMQLFLSITSEEFMKRSIDLLVWDFRDYDEFKEKYFEAPHPTFSASSALSH